jgi:UDPglucose 6-dehydrogenase
MKIGIVGYGYVGKATALLGCKDVEVLIWDIDPSLRNINELKDLIVCDFVFVCVPTPMNEDGSCHTDLVKGVAVDLIDLGVKSERIIIRSTIPVGTSKSLGVSFMPEFLTEANWEKDFRELKFRVIGLPNPKSYPIQSELNHLFKLASSAGQINSSQICYCHTDEAELAKLTRNTFLSVKVSFFNEIYQFCKDRNIDYEMVKSLVAEDERIGYSHTKVPGPDGNMGYGGTCFPKDIHSLSNQMEESGTESYILKSSILRNSKIDRPDWKEQRERGRAVK